jgi:hypothetical protein
MLRINDLINISFDYFDEETVKTTYVVLRDFDFKEVKAAFFKKRPHLMGVYGVLTDESSPNYKEGSSVFEPKIHYKGDEFLEYLKTSGYIAEPEVVDTFEFSDAEPYDDYWRNREWGWGIPRDDSLVDADIS